MGSFLFWTVSSILTLWGLGRLSRNNPAHPLNAYSANAAAVFPVTVPAAAQPAQTELAQGISIPAASNNGIVPVLAAPVDLAVRAAAQTDSIVGGIDLYQQIQTKHISDAVPAMGQQPANLSAWDSVFSSPGVWEYILIADPSVTFLADISGHRVA